MTRKGHKMTPKRSQNDPKRSQNDPQMVPKQPQGCDSTSGTYTPRSLLLVEPFFFSGAPEGKKEKKFTCALNPPRFSLSQKATASEGKGVNRRPPPHPHSDTLSTHPLKQRGLLQTQICKDNDDDDDEGRRRRKKEEEEEAEAASA